MTQQEFKAAMKAIESEAAKRRAEVRYQYALAHSTYKEGDIISNGDTTIKITEISISSLGEFPTCIYSGPTLKKDLTPRKDGATDNIFQGSYGVILIPSTK